MRLEGTLPHVLAAPAADPTIASFYQLTWWLVLLKVAVVFVFLVLVELIQLGVLFVVVVVEVFHLFFILGGELRAIEH